MNLTFPESMPGLAPLQSFTLSEVEPGLKLYSLNSIQIPEVSFLLLDTQTHLNDYRPKLKGQLEAIGSPKPEDTVVLVIVNLSQDQPHANLLAPVVINTATSRAAQVILDNQSYSVAEPLVQLKQAEPAA